MNLKRKRWPLERVLLALAGTITLLSVVLQRACHLRPAIYENGDAPVGRHREATV